MHRCQSCVYAVDTRDTLIVGLGEDLAGALQAEARRSGRPKGEIVREAVAARLRQSRPASVMSRYFGAMRGPSDLSTNKSYRRVWTKRRP
jgi:hypothetical protein